MLNLAGKPDSTPSRPLASGSSSEKPSHRCVSGLLLVEDNPADVALLRCVLEDRGIKCGIKIISHGDVAMAYAQHRTHEITPAVILLDINLPGYDGLEVLKAIRENPIYARTRVGMYTSSTSPSDRTRALRAGADFYIEKPVTLDGLDRVAAQVAAALDADQPRTTS